MGVFLWNGFLLCGGKGLSLFKVESFSFCDLVKIGKVCIVLVLVDELDFYLYIYLIVVDRREKFYFSCLIRVS